MPDFSHLMQLHVTSATTAELTLTSVQWPDGSSPILVGRYAGESNKPYFNAQTRAITRRAKTSRSVSAAFISEVRGRDLDLFPKHVITGWRNVIETSGKPCEFSLEACAEFLAQLPSEIFDEIRAFFANRDNFTDGVVTTEDAAETGKS